MIKINEYSDVLVASFNYSKNYSETLALRPDRVTTSCNRYNHRYAVGFTMTYAPECPVCNLLILSAIYGNLMLLSFTHDTGNATISGCVTRLVLNARTNEILTIQVEFEGIEIDGPHETTTTFIKYDPRSHLDIVHNISGLCDYNFTIERGAARIVGSQYIPAKSHTVSAQLSLYLSPPLPDVKKTDYSMYTIHIANRRFTVYGTVFYNVPLLMPQFQDCIVQVNVTNGFLDYV